MGWEKSLMPSEMLMDGPGPRSKAGGLLNDSFTSRVTWMDEDLGCAPESSAVASSWNT